MRRLLPVTPAPSVIPAQAGTSQPSAGADFRPARRPNMKLRKGLEDGERTINPLPSAGGDARAQRCAGEEERPFRSPKTSPPSAGETERGPRHLPLPPSSTNPYHGLRQTTRCPPLVPLLTKEGLGVVPQGVPHPPPTPRKPGGRKIVDSWILRPLPPHHGLVNRIRNVRGISVSAPRPRRLATASRPRKSKIPRTEGACKKMFLLHRRPPPRHLPLPR